MSPPPSAPEGTTSAAPSSAFRIQHSAFVDPPRSLRAALRHLGPGLIITATIVGSGELIVTPKLGAAAGFSLLWFVVFGCLVKVFVQIELARYAVATGRTTLEAFDSLPGPRLRVSWVVWLWMGMYVGTVLQVGGIVGGIASVLAELGLGGDPRVWALPVGVSCAALLSRGRYQTVEAFSTVMVVIFSVCTIVALAALQWTPYQITGGDLAEGFAFRLPGSLMIAFAAFGVTGVGASELIYYPYWCLEKGYARRIGPHEPTPAWQARAAGWLRVMQVDAWMSLVVYTAVTAAFYLLGAAVLHARGLAVTDADLIATLAEMYRGSFGTWGTVVLLCGAFFTLYSTFFVATASNARLFVDAAAILGAVRGLDAAHRGRLVGHLGLALPLVSTGLYLVWERPVTLVLIGAFGQALMLPFLGYAAIHLRRRLETTLPASSRLWATGLWLSALAMAGLGLYQIVDLGLWIAE